MHVDCMLFPEMRTYRWLMSKKRAAEAIGELHLYEMVYLNDPAPEGFVFWTREISERAFDHHRGIGIPDDLPHLYRIAGLDPSASRFQAGFLWGIDLNPPLDSGVFKKYMIDVDNRRGGGLDPFLELAKLWLEMYELRHWVVEVNMYRTGFIKEPRAVNWFNENGILVEPHETQTNKHDPLYGVGSMRSDYTHDDPAKVSVNLPYGSPEAKAKTELYVSQQLRFTDNAEKLRRRTTDLLMASWFPQKVIRRLISEQESARQQFEYSPSFSGFDVTSLNDIPWS